MLGLDTKTFCGVIERSRSLIYGWKGRDGRLKDRKPIAKTYPTKISGRKRSEVVVEYDRFGMRMGGWSISNIVGGVSESKTKEIIRESKWHIREYYRKLEEKIRSNHYEFTGKHTCWSWDVVHIWLERERMYLQVLRDECTRFILNWVITAGITYDTVKGFLMGTVDKYGLKPLVFKRDNEAAINTETFKWFLNVNKIVDLPSPPYYARYQGHHERGNGDIRSFLSFYELNPCLLYSEMQEKVERTVDLLNNRKPRMNFDGKTSAHMFSTTEPVSGINPAELIDEIKKTEEGWSWSFKGKDGDRKKHRFAVIEVLKKGNLLKVEIEPWQCDFDGKNRYNVKGQAVNQLKLPCVQ